MRSFTSAPLGLRAPLIAGLALALLAGLAIGQLATAGTSESCSVVAAGSFGESSAFTAYESRRTTLAEIPLNRNGAPTPRLPTDVGIAVESLDGLGLRWAVVTNTGSVYRYFAGKPITASLTRAQFLDGGGVEFDLERLSPDDPFWSTLLQQFPERALPVAIGPHKGVVVWADPGPTGSRSHNLYWSQGPDNYSLIANRSAEEVVSLARGLVCG